MPPAPNKIDLLKRNILQLSFKGPKAVKRAISNKARLNRRVSGHIYRFRRMWFNQRNSTLFLQVKEYPQRCYFPLRCLRLRIPQ